MTAPLPLPDERRRELARWAILCGLRDGVLTLYDGDEVLDDDGTVIFGPDETRALILEAMET